MQFHGIHGKYDIITFTRKEMEAIVSVLKFVVTHDYKEMPEYGAFDLMEHGFYNAEAFESALKEMDNPNSKTHTLETLDTITEDMAVFSMKADKQNIILAMRGLGGLASIIDHFADHIVDQSWPYRNEVPEHNYLLTLNKDFSSIVKQSNQQRRQPNVHHDRERS